MKRKTRKRTTVGVPTNLDFEKALMFFHAYMYGPLQGKLRLYGARAVHSAAKALSSDWEVFASILVNDVGTKLTKGVDLKGYEVKSAENRGGYEYQYHKNTGRKKLRQDMRVGHLFFQHSNNLQQVELRYVPGRKLSRPFFRPWLTNFPDPYRQRYRKTVPLRWVQENGTLLMKLQGGEVKYPKLRPVAATVASKGLQDDSQ